MSRLEINRFIGACEYDGYISWQQADDMLMYLCDNYNSNRNKSQTVLWLLYRDVYAGEPVTYSNELIRDLLTAISTNDVDLIRAELLKLIKKSNLDELDETADILASHHLKYEPTTLYPYPHYHEKRKRRDSSSEESS